MLANCHFDCWHNRIIELNAADSDLIIHVQYKKKWSRWQIVITKNDKPRRFHKVTVALAVTVTE